MTEFSGFNADVSISLEFNNPTDSNFWSRAIYIAHEDELIKGGPFFSVERINKEADRVVADMQRLVRGVGVVARIHGGELDGDPAAYAYASEVQDLEDHTWAVRLGGVAVRPMYYGHGLSASVAGAALGVYQSDRPIEDSTLHGIEMLLYRGFEQDGNTPISADNRLEIPSNRGTVGEVLAAITEVFGELPRISNVIGRRS